MRGSALATLLCVCLASCAHDAVLPDLQGSATCGNGVVEPGEACDNKGPGCAQCQVIPTFQCTGNTCSPICGDGVVGTGSTCAGAHRDSACDLSGFWAVRETTYSCDVFHNPQTTSQWYLYEIAQTGSDFQIVSNFDCGVHVTGSVTVDYTLPSLRGAMYANPMDGSGSHGHRHGTSMPVSGGCAGSLDRWYMLEGVTTDYLPPDFSAKPALSTLPPLPVSKDPLSTEGTIPGATDPDGDGFDGLGIRVTGLVTGIREAAQRDWTEFATPAGASFEAATLSVEMPGGFGLQQNVLHVTDCGTGCGLLTTEASASTAPARVVLSFIGKSLGGARTSTVVTAPPRKSLDADLETCSNLRQLLPHDGSAPAGACPGGGL
jgi:hypothetical protein